MTLKTTKEQRDEWRKSWNCPSEFVPLLDDADRAGEMEKELAQCMEALTAARKGQPLGPVVGAQTIINQQREIADLRAKLEEQKALVARLIEWDEWYPWPRDNNKPWPHEQELDDIIYAFKAVRGEKEEG